MRMRKVTKRMVACVVALVLFSVISDASVKAEAVTTVVMTYEDKVYTKQLYGVDTDQIKDGVETEGLRSIGGLCDNLTFQTNGSVTVDKNAVMTTVKNSIIAGQTSINIDLTKYTPDALKALATTNVVALPVTSLTPSVTDASGANVFSPVVIDPAFNPALNSIGIDWKISESSTNFRANEDRAQNIRNAASKINGMIIQPGQLFSCNMAFGPRTVENGYGLGNVINGDTYVKGVGGGICQVSSTLNLAVLRAGIIPIERHNHSHRSSYIKSGLDATISGNSLDYKFVNTLPYPIYISAITDGGVIKVSIYSNHALGVFAYEPNVVGSNLSNTTYLVGTLGGVQMSNQVCYSSRYTQ